MNPPPPRPLSQTGKRESIVLYSPPLPSSPRAGDSEARRLSLAGRLHGLHGLGGLERVNSASSGPVITLESATPAVAQTSRPWDHDVEDEKGEKRSGSGVSGR